MNLAFEIYDLGNKILRLQDNAQLSGEYIPEDREINEFSSEIYLMYKYSETYSINIVQYNPTKESVIKSISYNDHSKEDIEDVAVEKDGYYTITHIVLPSLNWYNSKLEIEDYDWSKYESVFVTDGEKIYQRVQQNSETYKLRECELDLITEINTYNSTVSRCTKDIFLFHDLYKCFLALCNQVFDQSIVSCSNSTDSSSRYNRDLIWSAINVMKIHVSDEQFESAQLLLEKLDVCNGVCKHINTKNGNESCGCS